MTRSVEELRRQIAVVREGEERMYTLDFLHRQWIALMVAYTGTIADELEQRFAVPPRS